MFFRPFSADNRIVLNSQEHHLTLGSSIERLEGTVGAMESVVSKRVSTIPKTSIEETINREFLVTK